MSRVATLVEDAYWAQLVDTDTESDLEESPSKIGTRTDSSHSSASSDSTTPLSPDHLLTHVLPTPTPARVSFHRDEDHGLSNESHGLEDEGLGLEEEEAVPEGQQQAVSIVETAASEPLGLGYGALRRRELAVEEDRVPSTFEVSQSSRSVPERQGAERIFAFRQPTLVTWVDTEDDKVYIDVPAYAPPAAPVQTPPSLEWLLGSLPVSPSSLVVPSPIALPVATPIATISVEEDQFIEVGAQLELHRSILHDLPPTLVADIDRDVRELYTRSKVVRDDMFSQRYKFRSLEREQERTVMTFGALWRLVPALEAWAGHVDTRFADMSQDRYDYPRLIHDMLLLQAAM
ncbi:hypothetical protein Tco_0838518 [Tanacetum coccineum]|uniref:Uncharacterized protein n=1 Tax=Tanacetum coccineum TaxID=301880 RepID=A0ABQ5AN03_9ASTR